MDDTELLAALEKYKAKNGLMKYQSELIRALVQSVPEGMSVEFAGPAFKFKINRKTKR